MVRRVLTSSRSAINIVIGGHDSHTGRDCFFCRVSEKLFLVKVCVTMSSISSFASGDLFEVSIVKSLLGSINSSWVNTYQFQATAGGTIADVETLGLNLVAFEQVFHNGNTFLTEARVATYRPDSKPYNPDTFLSIPSSAGGVRNPVVNPLPLNQTWFVKRDVDTGRYGKLEYRSVLQQSDVVINGGKYTLSSTFNGSGLLSSAFTAGSMAISGGIVTGKFKMVMITKKTGIVRPVTGLTSAGVSDIKTDHVFFHKGIRRINGR